MGGPTFNRDGRPLSANDIAFQKMDEEKHKQDMRRSQEVTAVLKRMPFLANYVGEIVEVYTKGGVRGFKFVPSDYDLLKAAIDRHIQKFVEDGKDAKGDSDAVGAFMGSDAHKHGFLLSLRSKSDTSSVHIELKKGLCDAHIDSVSTTTATPGFPQWGNSGQYNPTRFIDHFVKDLLPFYLEDARPYVPVFGTLLKDPKVYQAVTKGLSRTSVDLKLGERYDPANPLSNMPGAPVKDSRITVNFSVIEWR